MYFGKLPKFQNVYNDFSATYAPGLWKFNTGARFGKKAIIQQTKGVLTGSWILPATAIWHLHKPGVPAFALDDCEFKMKFYIKRMVKNGAIQALFKTKSQNQT